MLSVKCSVRSLRIPTALIRRTLQPLLRRAGGRGLEVVVVGRKAMRRLNREHHQCDEPTDVLAFPGDGRVLLGSVVVCADVALRESRARGLTFGSELTLYAVHGTLHLLGHRDDSLRAAERMRRAEVRALRVTGLLTDRGQQP